MPGSKKPRRAPIPPLTAMKLWVEAGGRCEICNEDLLRDGLTLQEANFAHIAHIVAASLDGPRGQDPLPRNKRNQGKNLMLLCHKHHKLIDDATLALSYPKARLLQYKKTHEGRIHYVTGLHAASRTTLLRLRCRIGTQAAEIPFGDMRQAVLPRYPVDPQGINIDLTEIGNSHSPGFWQLASARVRDRIEAAFAPGIASEKIEHVSIFALAPIPLLIHLGRCLSNKIPASLYQRHRGSEDWRWRADGPPVHYAIRSIKTGLDRTRVGVMLSLSGTIPTASLPREIRTKYPLYQMTLSGTNPNPTFLRRVEDLGHFVVAYHSLLSQIHWEHPRAHEIHLFAAVPAPIAVACGREPLPRAHSSLALYDFDKNSHNGWNRTL